MADKPKAAIIGGFILSSAVLIAVAIGLWGSRTIFEEKERFLCYFPGSVNGLDPGAPVKYRGVQIGTVADVRLRFEQADENTRIPVFIELYGKQIRERRSGRAGSFPALVAEMIRRGLRARLESQSLLTGQLYVNLELLPDTPAVLSHVGPSPYPEIPALPTTLEEAAKSISSVLDQIQKTDIAGIARSLESTVQGVHRLVSKASIDKTLNELPPTIETYRRLGEELSAGVAARGPLVTDLQRALVDVQKAAQSVSALAEYLQRNPNAVIMGRKRR